MSLIEAITAGDFLVLDWIHANLVCPFFDAVMPVITKFADSGIGWIALAIILLLPQKTRRAGVAALAALFVGFLICNVAIKPLVARVRPYDVRTDVVLLVDRLHDFSFPSGHVNASFAAAVALWRCDKRLGIPATILAVIIAFSRLYLYVHYPTDVLAAVITGTIAGHIGYSIIDIFWRKPRKNAALSGEQVDAADAIDAAPSDAAPQAADAAPQAADEPQDGR